MLRALFQPGFFATPADQVAAVVGGLTAVVSAVVGVFTVVRGQSFAGHAFGDVASTGASGAFLLGISPLWGFLTASLVAAGAMEVSGLRRPRGRDVATGIVLGAALGLSALLLFLGSTSAVASNTTQTVLFGSILTIDRSLEPVFAALAVAALGAVAILWRPLLLASLDPGLAAARGVRVRLVEVLYLVSLAVAVSLSAMTVGAILSTALLVGPPAAALRLTARPGRAMAVAAAFGIGCTWLGILLAYDSYRWPPAGHGWPVSFLIVAAILAVYLFAEALGGLARRRRFDGSPDRRGGR